MVSEKSPLSKALGSKLKPGFISVAALSNEAMLVPLLIQLTWMRDCSIWPPVIEAGNVTLQGRLAFAFGPACISLGDTVNRGSKGREKRKSLYWSAPTQQNCCNGDVGENTRDFANFGDLRFKY